MSDHLELMPLDPLYRAIFPDGSTLDVRSGVDAMAAEIEQVCGGAEAAGYRRFVDVRLRALRAGDERLHRPQFRPPVEPRAQAARPPRRDRRAAPAGAESRLVPEGSAHPAGAVVPGDVRGPVALRRARDLRGHQLPGLGGRRVLPARRHARGPAGAGGGCRQGRASNSATAQPCRAGRGPATGGRTASSSMAANGSPADAVVLTPDAPGGLARAASRPGAAGRVWKRRLPRQQYSPSCFLLLAGSSSAYPGAAHHTISFGRAWRRTFTELIDRRELMSDPSLLVTCATASDPGARPGRAAHVLRARPGAEPRRPARLVGDRAALPRRAGRDAGAARMGRLRVGHRGRADHDPGGLARAGHGARSAVRGRAHLPARPARSGCPISCRAWRTSCSPAPERCPASACRWCWCQDAWPRSGSRASSVQRRPRAAQADLLAAEQPARRRVVVAQPVGEGGKP